jgi:hypothetical protein
MRNCLAKDNVSAKLIHSSVEMLDEDDFALGALSFGWKHLVTSNTSEHRVATWR